MAGTTGQIDAVVLAGGINRIRLYNGYVPAPKALLEFAGRPSVNYVLAALRGVPQIGRIAVVGSAAALRPAVWDRYGCEFVEGAESLGGNILRGLRHFATSPAVLFATADAPLLTAEAIVAFFRACAEKGEQEGTAYLSFVPVSAFSGPFAGRQKARVFFRDLVACHGNLALIDPHLTDRLYLLSNVDHLYRVRKETLKTIFAFGWTVGVSYLLGGWLTRQLSIEQMAGIASRRLGIRLIPVLSDWPEIVIDVDEPQDYAFVRAQLEGE